MPPHPGVRPRIAGLLTACSTLNLAGTIGLTNILYQVEWETVECLWPRRLRLAVRW